MSDNKEIDNDKISKKMTKEEAMEFTERMRGRIKENLATINEILDLKTKINEEKENQIIDSLIRVKSDIDDIETIYRQHLGQNFGEDYEFNRLYREFKETERRILKRVIAKKEILNILGIQQKENKKLSWIREQDDVYSIERELLAKQELGETYKSLIVQILQEIFLSEDIAENLKRIADKKEDKEFLRKYEKMKSEKQKSYIMDYDDVNDRIEAILDKQNTENKNIIIKEEEPIGYSAVEHIPIRHFSIGTGKKHFIYTAAMHGNQIISTEFVLKTMEELKDGKSNPETIDLLNKGEITIDFIPIFNPEGYIITTSAVRQLIPKDMTKEEAEKISKDYYSKLRNDNIDEQTNKVPEFRTQRMFRHIDYAVIPEKYGKLRETVKKRQAGENIPPWTLKFTSSNGNGVDLNEDTENNTTRQKQKSNPNESIYNGLGYIKNIPKSEPSPIGYPGKPYTTQPENLAFEGFLTKLTSKDEIIGMYNLGATGGKIYFNPSPEWNLPEKWVEYNRVASEQLKELMGEADPDNVYSCNDDKSRTCRNDFYRKIVPGDFFITLSRMGGNPIAPYGDLKNHDRVMSLTDVLLHQISKMCELYKQMDLNKEVEEMDRA